MRVLHVEDDDFHAYLIARALKKEVIGLELIRVSSGEEALAYLQGQAPFEGPSRPPSPDIVLLDLFLNGIDGFAVLDWRRKSFPDPRIAWVVLTASDSAEDRDQATRLGATAYFVKGTDYAALCRWVAERAARTEQKPK